MTNGIILIGDTLTLYVIRFHQFLNLGILTHHFHHDLLLKLIHFTLAHLSFLLGDCFHTCHFGRLKRDFGYWLLLWDPAEFLLSEAYVTVSLVEGQRLGTLSLTIPVGIFCSDLNLNCRLFNFLVRLTLLEFLLRDD